MTARIVEIAEALVTAYQAGYAADPPFISQQIAVSRTYVQITKKAVSDMIIWDASSPVPNAINVYIMTVGETHAQEDDSRGIFWLNYGLCVGVAARPATTSTADIDPLMQVSQELRDYLMAINPPVTLGIPEGVVAKPEIICDPDLDALKTDKLFMSMFTVAFQGGRSR